MSGDMQVNGSSATPYSPEDTKPAEAKKPLPSDRLPEMISSGNKIDEKEYVELFGEEGKREYDLSDKKQYKEFINKLGEKYSLPTVNEEIKPNIKLMKATKKPLELQHEHVHVQGEQIVLNPDIVQNEKLVDTLKEILNNFTSLNKGTEQVLKAMVDTFKKEDGTIDTEGLKQFLSNIAGEGGKANLQEIQAALQKIGNTEGKAIHVIDQCDPKDVKEGDYGIQGDKTYKYTNGQWEEIQAQ